LPALILAFSLAPEALGGGARVFEIPSVALRETRVVKAFLPNGYEDSGERLPVLYKLDGEWDSPAFSLALERLAREGRIPRMILVAVENTDRHRDMTPTRVAGHSRTGEADNFLDFFRRELIPFIDARLRTTSERFLFGHSLAGLFTVYAFLSAPDLFDGYIATSPSLPHDLKKLVFLAVDSFEREGFAGRTLYLATGTEDLDGYLDAARAFAGYLDANAPEGLRWRFDALEGEDHRTTPYAALDTALIFLRAKTIE